MVRDPHPVHRPAASPSDEDLPASQRFRFRFMTRGEQADTLAWYAMRSLRQCHPNAAIVLVDANDKPTWKRNRPPIGGDFTIVHVPPDQDEVARAVGRGSRRHMFYWRHSPQVRDALPPTSRYCVYADADLIFLRPLDLVSLLSPLARGRIAAVVDESTLEYYQALEMLAPQPASTALPASAAGGPLVQAGLIFTNPHDDGGLFDLFWDLAVHAAQEGYLAHLPWDDMSLLTGLLAQAGPLWERLLILGHDWNYITDEIKEPGIFGRTAHYGGHRAKALLLSQAEQMFSAERTASPAWGTIAAPERASPQPFRGHWHRDAADQFGLRAAAPRQLPVPLPFCLSWHVPPGAVTVDLAVHMACSGTCRSVHVDHVAFYVYLDGRYTHRVAARAAHNGTAIHVAGAETITIIGVSATPGHRVDLDEPFVSGGSLTVPDTRADLTHTEV